MTIIKKDLFLVSFITIKFFQRINTKYDLFDILDIDT